MRFFLILPFLFPLPLTAQSDLSPKDRQVLNELEKEVNSLKEGVYRTKTRLHELEETILRGKITGSKAFIHFDNRAEGFFALSSAEFYLDEKLVLRVDAEGRKEPVRSLEVYDSDLPSGEHALRAKIQYRGNDQAIYKMFSYFKDHRFDLETSFKFAVEYGKTAVVKLIALDRGHFTTDIQERLYLKNEVSVDWGAEPPG